MNTVVIPDHLIFTVFIGFYHATGVRNVFMDSRFVFEISHRFYSLTEENSRVLITYNKDVSMDFIMLLKMDIHKNIMDIK